MSNAVRFTQKIAIQTFQVYALLLIALSSAALAGCSGLVSSSNTAPPSTLAITNVQTASVTTSSSQVVWTTNVAADSSVDYGTTTSYGNSTPVDSTMVTSHQMTLSGLAAGTTYYYQVNSTDSKGNHGHGGNKFNTTGFSLSGAITPTAAGNGATVALNGATSASATADSSGNYAFAGLANGTYTIAPSHAGFTFTPGSKSMAVNGANVTGVNFTATATTVAPSITSLNPTSGVLGTPVTITGANFGATQGTSSVAFNGIGATPTSWSATSIAVPVPAGATTGNVVVTVSGVASNGVSFTVTVPAPSITSLSPTSGLVGVSVTISGANFGTTQGTSAVTFSGVAAAATSWSATSIVVPVPAGATTGNVVVTVGGVASNGVSFTVTVPTPSITSLNPASGLVGTSVTITGTNFGATQGTNTVKFNGTTATPASWSATSIVAPVPVGATTGNVVVTVSGVASNGVSFTVQADTVPPSTPTGLTATAISSSQINLSWTASTDNVGVTGYNLYRAGIKIGTSGNTSYQDTGLTASTSYSYTVAAFDAAGNISAQSTGASATTQASTGGGGLPSSLGWYQIPNTTLQSVCPPNNYGGSGYNFSDGCHAVVDAWGGGVADTSRNRLIVWGGGHSDYAGNEVYALDLNSLSVMRLNNPALPLASGCVEALSGPSPNSRHSYDDLAYIANADQMLVVTGSMAPTGCASTGAWTLNMSNLTWTQQSPSGTAPNYSGGLAAISYDPNTKLVFISSEAYASFASYNSATNAYTMLNSSALTDYHETSVIDPSRKLFFMFGAGNAYKIDISGNDPNYTLTNISASGCGFVSSVYPGVAFDSSQNLIVGWAGGNTAYLYNPTTDSCSSVTYPNGPGAQQANGTYKRFSYFPALNVFALVNSVTQNAYALRLTSGGGTGGGTGPNISGVSTNSITTSGATITWTTDVASTTQVEYGTTTAYGTLTTLNSSLVTSHSQALSGLAAGTLYHYRVHSKNSSGVESISGDFAFSTNSGTTNPPPTVSVTAPAANATVSGTVTVSANASSSVGIANVQFALDGVNLGSAVTTSPYQTSWNTTTATNGAHSLAATATDTAGSATASTPVTVTVSNATSGQSSTYQQRCAASGVLKCVSLDNPSQFNNSPTMSQNWYPAADGVYRCNIDNSVFPPDGPTGSLNCVVPPQIGANASGNFNDTLGGTFGPSGDPNAANGNTFYIQLRERMDSSFVALHTDGEGFKLFGVHGLNPDSTCQSVGIVIQNEWWRGMPTGFVNCGAQSLQPINTGPTSADQLEQGDYNCTYGAPGPYTLPNCFQFMANQWMTFEMKVVINNWDPSGTLPGSGSNTIQVWGAYEGQPLKKFIDLTNFPINFQNSAGDVFSKFILYDYDTNRTTTNSYPVANCWYSEVVVSTQPILAPDGPTVQ